MISSEDTSQGLASYSGYEYQILATVWIALDIISTGRAEAIVIEPPSIEDVEIDLHSQSVDSSLQLTQERDWGVQAVNLQIQIKLRNNSLWKKNDLNGLIKARRQGGSSGPKPRIRPLEYLGQNSSKRYLLFTNASVDKGLTEFLVAQMGDLSNAKRIPRAHSDDVGLASRVGIFREQSEELLNHKIRIILQSNFHVPGENVDACMKQLIDSVRARLLGKKANRFPRSEVLSSIREFGGSYPDSVEPVRSSKHGIIEEQLENRFVLTLVGPPGTGKTTLAEYLISKLETNANPYRLISGPEKFNFQYVRSLLNSNENHIFYYEDPWGQDPVHTSEGAAATNNLPKLFLQARQGKVFVVTSRLNVFRQATKDQERLFSPFVQELLPSDYDKNAYSDIFEREIAKWEPSRLEFARHHKSIALDQLQTPNAIVIFCMLLREKDLSKQNAGTIKSLAKESNVDALGAILKTEITKTGKEAVEGAVAIWLLLITQGRRISADDALLIRQRLATTGYLSPPDVSKLFNVLTDAKWLQARSDGYVATPSVTESFALLEIDEPAAFTDIMTKILEAWSANQEFEKIIDAVKAIRKPARVISDGVRLPLTEFLVARALSTEGYRFSGVVMELVEYAEGDHPVVVLAKALANTEGARPRQLGYIWPDKKWKRPELPAEAVNSISKSREARNFLSLHISNQLKEHRWHGFGPFNINIEDFLDFLNLFDWDLCGEFEKASTEAINRSDEGGGFLLSCAAQLNPEFVDVGWVGSECICKMVRGRSGRGESFRVNSRIHGSDRSRMVL